MQQHDRFCFVLMPFKDEFKSSWLYGVKKAAKNNNLKPIRADDEELPVGIITEDIRKLILDSEIIIAEMTGQNPNVLYELGLAHSAKKKVIMITQKKEDIPFDIQGQGIRYIKYDNNHIDKLEKKLTKYVETALEQKETKDLFSELKIFTSELQKKMTDFEEETKLLRPLAYPLEVTTDPKFSYIFLNNKYIGKAPQTLYVNPYIRNIITVFAVEHFEEYIILNKKDIENRRLNIKLSLRDKELYPSRVHNWLKYIRENPNDIVIGRAVATYLQHIKEHEKAIKELERLIGICNNWSMLYNGIGISKSSLKKYDKAILNFKKVKEMEANTYIGYYNLACGYSLLKDYKACLNEIEAIVENPAILESLYKGNCRENFFDNESDFDNIRNDNNYGKQFEEYNEIYKKRWRACS